MIGLSLFMTSFAQAAYIDFTNSAWQGAQGLSSFTYDGVTLSSTGGSMTFNSSSWEKNGCANSHSATAVNLACDGDGIGIRDDEITGNAGQKITVTFSSAVNIVEVELLDLFPNEGGTGNHEVAIINASNLFSNPVFLAGGYYATGFQSNGTTTLEFSAANDNWSDYALARITTSSVPEPASIAMLAIGLIGLGAARKRSN